MFCWKCGTADQKPNEYCVNCNEYLRDNSLLRAKDSPTTVLIWSIFFNVCAIIAVLLVSYLVNLVFIGGDRKLLFWAMVICSEVVFANVFNIFLAYRLRERISVKKIETPQPVMTEIGHSRVAALINDNIPHSYSGPSITEDELVNRPRLKIEIKDRR